MRWILYVWAELDWRLQVCSCFLRKYMLHLSAHSVYPHYYKCTVWYLNSGIRTRSCSVIRDTRGEKDYVPRIHIQLFVYIYINIYWLWKDGCTNYDQLVTKQLTRVSNISRLHADKKLRSFWVTFKRKTTS